MTWRIWLPRAALLLILAGQLNYLPDRIAFWRQLWIFTHLPDQTAAARFAYGAADYDLLTWIERQTSPETTILLVSASPRTYGDPAYVLYHRALYRLYPRQVWWAAPVPATRYPAWWTPTDLSAADLLALARRYQATTVLASGFREPPLPGSVRSFDETTHLIFLAGDE